MNLWWSCWNEGALLLISVKLSLILRSSALFLVTPMHNYEEIWMFTQVSACSNTAMFLCCAMTWWLYVGVLAVPSAPPTNVTIESVSSTVSNTYNASPDFPMKIVELVHVKSTRHTLICPDNFMFDFDVAQIKLRDNLHRTFERNLNLYCIDRYQKRKRPWRWC